LATEALSLTNVHAFYGDSHILHSVGFSLSEGRVLARTLENIRQSLGKEPRAIYVIYVAPAQEELLRSAEFLAPVARDLERNYCIFRNAAAGV